MKMQSKIEGQKALTRSIQRLSKGLDPDKVEPILFKGADKVTQLARANAPMGSTGALKQALVTKKLERTGDQPAPSLSGVDQKVAFYARFVEYGTAKMPARPFFRPAWDSKFQETRKFIRNELKKLIMKAAKKK